MRCPQTGRAAITLFIAHRPKVRPERHNELVERVVQGIDDQARLARDVRRLFWDDAIALIRRGCAAKAPAKRIYGAVWRLAVKRSGTPMPLGCGVFREDELKALVNEEIAAWVAEQKGWDNGQASAT